MYKMKTPVIGHSGIDGSHIHYYRKTGYGYDSCGIIEFLHLI